MPLARYLRYGQPLGPSQYDELVMEFRFITEILPKCERISARLYHGAVMMGILAPHLVAARIYGNTTDSVFFSNVYDFMRCHGRIFGLRRYGQCFRNLPLEYTSEGEEFVDFTATPERTSSPELLSDVSSILGSDELLDW